MDYLSENKQAYLIYSNTMLILSGALNIAVGLPVYDTHIISYRTALITKYVLPYVLPYLCILVYLKGDI